MNDNRELKHLLSLLDDDSDSVAIPVLAALLERHTDLLPHLADLQESSDPAVRRRVHQLQSILTFRERRYTLLRKIEENSLSFPEAMTELHLQWFDCDAPDAIYSIYIGFADEFNKSGVKTLSDAVQYMLKCGFFAIPDTSLEPEIYCLGPALTCRKIAESLLCGLIRHMLPDVPVRVFYTGERFVLTDGEITVAPAEIWKISNEDISGAVEYDDRMLLKLALSMIFSNSVSQDHFRYIYTVGQALTGCNDDKFLDALPYPYCRIPESCYGAQNKSGLFHKKGDI